ncbi:MAG: hypothetical protein NWE78_06795 [Candidatus Bathyarchaeota archaeon]|nr:hypothetical protein [Candidatus Bathyarchaeota archaeon]
MRSDYPLYAIAILCFVITAVAYSTLLVEVTSLYIYGLIVLGIVFVGLGYMARPKTPTAPQTSVAPAKPAENLTQEKQTPKTEEKAKVAPTKTAAKSTKASTKKPATRRTRKRTTRSKKKT